MTSRLKLIVKPLIICFGSVLPQSISVILLLTCFKIGNAQNAPLNQVNISSPTAASLGKYADFPISYHTGLPQISIPIYTVDAGPLELPISISYHAGGLKVMEPASHVGAGWSLNAGGMITRTVKGGPDDRGTGAAYTKFGHFHDFGYNSYLFSGGGAPCYPLSCPTGSSQAANDHQIASTIEDGEPDLYFFNFAGYTGKFYFHDDRTPVLVPKQDLKIEPILADETSSPAYIFMLGFIVTTPDGSRYYFGKNQNNDGNMDAIEITTSINTNTFPITNQGAVSSWFLTKIESADAQFSITLTYLPEKSSQYILSMFPVWNVDNTFDFSSPFGDHEYNLAKNFVNGVRLNQIIFPNGTVTFNQGIVRSDLGDYNSMVMADVPNTDVRSLGSIQVNSDNGFCKRFDFLQSFFVDNLSPLNGFYPVTFPVLANIASDKYRLRLDALQETTCDGLSKIPAHQFAYYQETVPRKLTFGQDHWGYYNGVTTNETLIPTYFENSIPKVGADRDAHWPAMRGGALQRITFPTGGYTNFEYDPHDTHGTITSTSSVPRISASVGYDGGSLLTTSYTFTSNLYQLDLFNYNSGSVCNVELINSSSVTVKNFSLNPGLSNTYHFTISPGTYTVKFTKSTSFTGQGAQASFAEWVPTTSQANIMIGGLRVKTITANDGITDNDQITQYSYTVTNGTQSSGMLYSRPVYVSLIRNDVVKLIGPGSTNAICSQNGCASCDGGGLVYPFYKSGGGIFPMETIQGNHIGYEEVKVTKSGNGHSIFRYYGSNVWSAVNSDIVTRTINTTICDPAVPTFPIKPLPFEYKRGDLKYEAHYKEGGSTPIKEIFHNPEYALDPITTPGYIAINATNFFWGTEYELQTVRKIKQETISFETDTESGNYLSNTNTVFYESPHHIQPTRSVTVNSTSQELKEITKYAFDFRISTCENISDGWQNYLTDYTAATNTFTSSLNCSDPTWNCRWIAYQQWRFDKSVARNNYINHRRSNFTDENNAYKTCMTNARNGADPSLKPILELRNIFKNAPLEITSWKADKLIGAAFTKYEYSNDPSTHVYPARSQQINLSSPSVSYTNTSVSGSSIDKDLRFSDESSAVFNKGNLSSLTGRDGIETTYFWDYKNTVPVAKVLNAGHGSVAYTSFEAESKGNWVFTGAPTSEPTSPTGKKSYQLTSGSISRTGLNAGTNYWTTYWLKDQSGTALVNNNSGILLVTRNNWKLYRNTVQGATEIIISGNGVIDEVRLFPEGSQMLSYAYEPVVGITSMCDANNRILYYEYDNFGRLRLIRDESKNIIEKYDYQYQAPIHNNAVWAVTGITRCKPCAENGNYVTNIVQNEEKDSNPHSATYNQTRWTDAGTGGSCAVLPDWQNTTTAIRCKKDGSNQNTGEQEQEQKDLNPCSLTYDQLRWVVTGTDYTACPLPYVCGSGNCTNNGPDWACINNICEQGIKIYHAAVQVGTDHWWCYYHYEFTDGSWSAEFSEDSAVECMN